MGRPVRWAGFVWLGLVTVLSLLPLPLKDLFHTRGVLHWWGHLLVFALTALWFCFPRAGILVQASRTAAIFSFGVLLEFLQHAIYGSVFEWSDAGTDALGTLLGLITASLVW